MNDALASQEDRHRVEIKKAIEKQTASEKIKKDRWVDLKTKKIKVINVFKLIRVRVFPLSLYFNIYLDRK